MYFCLSGISGFANTKYNTIHIVRAFLWFDSGRQSTGDARGPAEVSITRRPVLSRPPAGRGGGGSVGGAGGQFISSGGGRLQSVCDC